MANNLDSFTEDRMPLCETLSIDRINESNATIHDIGLTEVAKFRLWFDYSYSFILVALLIICATNHLYSQDCNAKLELETLVANVSLEIMCGVLMGVINVVMRFVGKFWILCTTASIVQWIIWYLRSFSPFQSYNLLCNFQLLFWAPVVLAELVQCSPIYQPYKLRWYHF